MHLPGQIDDVQVESAGGGGGSYVLIPDDAASVQQQHYVQEQDHGVGGISGREGRDEDHDDGTEGDGMDGEAQVDAGSTGIMAVSGTGNQLTLSFQGEVYVFDSVSPEKVQAVLLLLGGRELTSGMGSPPPALYQYNKGSNFPQRMASLMRFRQKRKERNFDKKIRYTVRKDVALRMQRHKGQFTSSKSKPEDATAGVTNWEGTQQWGVMDGLPQAPSECCHCGISSKSTPMMRHGPDGPRTLCNACGLMWATKGTLRDLSRSAPAPLSTEKGFTSSEPNEAGTLRDLSRSTPAPLSTEKGVASSEPNEADKVQNSEYKIHIWCDKWKDKVLETVSKLEGMDKLDIDEVNCKQTVTGEVHSY